MKNLHTYAWATTTAIAVLGCAWLTATVNPIQPHTAWVTPGQTGVANIVVFALWALIVRFIWAAFDLLSVIGIIARELLFPSPARVHHVTIPLTCAEAWDARDEDRWVRHASMMRGTV